MSFNEGTRLDPSRIQRRGPGGARGGVAIGGGIGGLLIVLLFMLLGIDPSTVGLDPGSSGGGGAGSAQDAELQEDFATRCATGASANEHADCRVLATIESLDAFWVDALPAAGFRHRLPAVVVFDQATSSGCGQASSATGPFYCPLDQSMYIDTGFFTQLAAFGYEQGNLAEAYVVAHEYGHHIQNEMGIFDIADRSQTGPDSDTVRVELMADCLAGVWVGHAASVPDPDTGVPFLQPITEEQLQNAIAAAESVGDDRIQQVTSGNVSPHSFTHGTSQQRRDAFVTGYNAGTVAACDMFGVVGR
ncbi:MAG: neutral zinc metallopeptidase [Actinomycetes bacterium]|nr:MAG: hypothetical protein DIU73_03865 [Actinomycetota bacterium]